MGGSTVGGGLGCSALPTASAHRSVPLPAPSAAVSGLNIYDVLESCYHGHNPYTAGEQPSAAASPTVQRASLQEALASHRQWPLLGAAQPGRVPGLADVLGPLAHTPPCLDSRWVCMGCGFVVWLSGFTCRSSLLTPSLGLCKKCALAIGSNQPAHMPTFECCCCCFHSTAAGRCGHS